MSSKVYLSLALDKRLYAHESNRYNVKVIVYHNPDGKQLRRRCNTKCYLTEDEFKKLHQNGRKSDYLLETRIRIDNYFAEIKCIVDRLHPDFTFEKFDAIFQSKGLSVYRGRPSQRPKENRAPLFDETAKLTDLFRCFNDYAQELMTAKRYGTSISYKTAMTAFYKFRPDMMFQDVTPALLYGFEDWMLANGRSVTTVGIYTRSLRTIINLAIAEGNFPQESYPFGAKRKRKYQIPVTRNIKKALSIEDIRAIKTVELPDRDEEFARDMWMFSFYCNGMNMADIFFLRYENLDGDYLRFIRKKTVNTQREQIPVEVFLTDPAKEIIAKWGNPDDSPQNYVFSGMEGLGGGLLLYKRKCNFTRSVNGKMKSIARRLDLDRRLTTIVARHSYATTLKNLDVATEEISENLGHSDIKTTRFYLDSFSGGQKARTAMRLVGAI